MPDPNLRIGIEIDQDNVHQSKIASDKAVFPKPKNDANYYAQQAILRELKNEDRVEFEMTIAKEIEEVIKNDSEVKGKIIRLIDISTKLEIPESMMSKIRYVETDRIKAIPFEYACKLSIFAAKNYNDFKYLMYLSGNAITGLKTEYELNRVLAVKEIYENGISYWGDRVVSYLNMVDN